MPNASAPTPLRLDSPMRSDGTSKPAEPVAVSSHDPRLRAQTHGVRFVDGTGRLLRLGGKVVKNAAGFDLPKFFVGSLGGFTRFALRGGLHDRAGDRNGGDDRGDH